MLLSRVKFWIKQEKSVSEIIGFVLLIAAIAIGLFGRFVAPYPPDEMFGSPFEASSSAHIFGLDYVGRDVLSRFLCGGQTSIAIALVGTVVGEAIGIATGLISAFRGGWFDSILGRFTDLILAFPALILSLLLLATFGTSMFLVVVAIVITTAPGAARVTRSAAQEHVKIPYVEAARARGESDLFIMAFEILPNIKSVLLVDIGFRVSSSLVLVSALSFVGLGLQPPAADWGLMIGENRLGLTMQPWPVLVPACAIMFLTIGLNLIIDSRQLSVLKKSIATELSSHV